MARVLLIDDHPAVRHGLGLVLASQSHTICGEAGSVAETRERIASTPADIALLDLSLGDENGCDLVAELRAMGIATLVYSMHDDAPCIEAALAAGANGYVSKREMVDVLFAAIDEILLGRVYLSPLVSRHREQGGVPLQALRAPQDELLSERESSIMAMLGRGETNGAIAAQFAISVRTLETYFERICNKLCVDGTRELRRYAIASGMKER